MAETKEQHRERGRRTYAYLKEQHRCIKCQKQDAYTLAGRARCFECEEKHKEAVQRCNTPEKRAEREKRTRDNRRNSGACTACGKMMPVGDDHMTCQSCRDVFCARCHRVLCRRDKEIGAWARRRGCVHQSGSGREYLHDAGPERPPEGRRRQGCLTSTSSEETTTTRSSS